jgi:hypothetical protein
MPNIEGYTAAVVLLNRHEPEHEVAGRLLELAEEKDYDPRVVEAQRGEHDVPLSFRVPEDVAEAFNADRGDRWPSKIENEDETDVDRPAVDGDAFAADNLRRAAAAREANAAREDKTTPTARTQRPGKARNE